MLKQVVERLLNSDQFILKSLICVLIVILSADFSFSLQDIGIYIIGIFYLNRYALLDAIRNGVLIRFTWYSLESALWISLSAVCPSSSPRVVEIP